MATCTEAKRQGPQEQPRQSTQRQPTKAPVGMMTQPHTSWPTLAAAQLCSCLCSKPSRDCYLAGEEWPWPVAHRRVVMAKLPQAAPAVLVLPSPQGQPFTHGNQSFLELGPNSLEAPMSRPCTHPPRRALVGQCCHSAPLTLLHH